MNLPPKKNTSQPTLKGKLFEKPSECSLFLGTFDSQRSQRNGPDTSKVWPHGGPEPGLGPGDPGAWVGHEIPGGHSRRGICLKSLGLVFFEGRLDHSPLFWRALAFKPANRAKKSKPVM